MKPRIDNLREHLFEAIELAKDPKAEVDMDRLRMVNSLAQTLINSAKVEVDLLKTTGGMPDSAFFAKRPQRVEDMGGR